MFWTWKSLLFLCPSLIRVGLFQSEALFSRSLQPIEVNRSWAHALMLLKPWSFISFFLQLLCFSCIGLYLYRFNTNKSVELPADHNTSSRAYLRSTARANSNLTRSCKEILCDTFCLWKTHKTALQRFGGPLSQQTLSRDVSGEGHRLGEPGRKSAAGAWKRLQGATCPVGVTLCMAGRSSHLVYNLVPHPNSDLASCFSHKY